MGRNVVLFHKRGKRQAGPVVFEETGEGTQQILATDLAEGTWQVWRDGQIVNAAVPVSAESGTLFLEGPPGTYTLRR